MVRLLTALLIKHWLADFCFQTPYMLQKAKPWPDFLVPLASHAGFHALLTFCILQPTARRLAYAFAGADFLIHGIIDRFKAHPELLGQFQDPHSNVYWVVFGFDQLLHQFTYVAFVSFAFCRKGICEWTKPAIKPPLCSSSCASS